MSKQKDKSERPYVTLNIPRDEHTRALNMAQERGQSLTTFLARLINAQWKDDQDRLATKKPLAHL